MLNDDSIVTSVDTLQMGTGANWVDGGLLRWKNLEIHLCLSGQSRKAHFNKPLGQKQVESHELRFVRYTGEDVCH